MLKNEVLAWNQDPQEQGFNPEKEYHTEEGYTLFHDRNWKMYLNGRQIMSAVDDRFWEIVKLYDWKTYNPVIKKKDNQEYIENLYWKEGERDHNFLPSIASEYESVPDYRDDIRYLRFIRKYQ